MCKYFNYDYCWVLLISEIPSTPRNVTAVKETTLPDSDCVIYLQWQPPNNTERTEIRNYTTTIEYKRGIPSTPPATSLHASLNLIVKSCASDAVLRVSAVDSCGREGPSSNGTLIELLVPNPVTSVTASSTSSQSPPIQTGGLVTGGEFSHIILMSCTDLAKLVNRI